MRLVQKCLKLEGVKYTKALWNLYHSLNRRFYLQCNILTNCLVQHHASRCPNICLWKMLKAIICRWYHNIADLRWTVDSWQEDNCSTKLKQLSYLCLNNGNWRREDNYNSLVQAKCVRLLNPSQTNKQHKMLFFSSSYFS